MIGKDDIYSRTPFVYVKDILKNITDVKTSSGAREAINQAYDIVMYNNYTREELTIFGDTILNEAECMADYDYHNKIMEDYCDFEIWETYHISLDTYTNYTVEYQNKLMRNFPLLLRKKVLKEEEMVKNLNKEPTDQ